MPKYTKHAVIELIDPAKHDRTAFPAVSHKLTTSFAEPQTSSPRPTLFVPPRWSRRRSDWLLRRQRPCDRLYRVPDRLARNHPTHGTIPAAYISMIGVDSPYQGRGYGADLLMDCPARLAIAADALGIAGLILDVFDYDNPQTVAKRLALYTDYCFEPLPSNGLRLFLSIATVRMPTTQAFNP